MSSMQGLPHHIELLLRRPESNKSALKEKFVAIYEAFFLGHNPSAGDPVFWDELFLLRVNANYLERCIILTSEEQLLALKDNINLIFVNCCDALYDAKRCPHALETLCILLKCIFRKKFNNFGFDVLNTISGIDQAASLFKELLVRCKQMLEGPDTENGEQLKSLTVTLLVILVTATDNVNQNSIIEYFMSVDLFPTLMNGVSNEARSIKFRADSLFILAMLVNYRKYESSPNSYVTKMAQLTSFVHMEAIADCVHQVLQENNGRFSATYEKGTMMNKITDALSLLIPMQKEQPESSGPNTTGISLLFFYELIHRNNGFCSILLNQGHINDDRPSRSPAQDETRIDTVEELLQSPDARLEDLQLLSTFFTFCSYSFSNTNEVRSIAYAKICLITLICLTEKNQMVKFFHDVELSIPIYIKSKKKSQVEKQSPACIILELVNQFMRDNLKTLQPDMYSKAVGIVHRILVFEKRSGCSVKYRWLNLWDTLFLLMKVMTNQDFDRKPELHTLSSQVATVLNMFITFYEALLTPVDYDQLYYEILRNKKEIGDFFKTMWKFNASPSIQKDWSNVKTIIDHFGKEVDHWCLVHPDLTMSTEQVKEIIRENYETLKLNYLEHLDQFDNYVENPKEVSFFRQFIRILVFDCKTTIEVKPIG